jgi:glutamate N-acetyltransferase/amino-acid N-acetyltransferase
LIVNDATSTSLSNKLPLGFRWSSVKAGIKASGKLDLALAVCDGGAAAAAMFTSNQLVAAPVIVGGRHLTATGGRVSAVIVNAGNANCATGEPGIDDCRRSCVAVAEAFGCVFDEIFPSSTGIIGVPLPVEKIVAAVPAAKAALGDRIENAEAFATAILTTDTKRKIAQASFEIDGQTVNLFGCAKGAGMNAISIDGDMSTNDTVLLLASGKSGVLAAEVVREFDQALKRVCDDLAHKIVDDGEGVTHVVTLDITGAESDADAKTIARTIATSPLCKTAWSSADPNWGRLLAAAGRAGVVFDPAQVLITIGGLPVFEYGVRAADFDEAATHAAMSEREYTIMIHLGPGSGRAHFTTCDLTHEYVSINADYST